MTEHTTDEDDALPSLFETSGLELSFWPAWAPVPGKAVFVPYLSLDIKSETGEKSFSTVIDAHDVISALSDFARILRLTFESGLQAQSKLDIFDSKERTADRLKLISDNLQAAIDIINSKDLLLSHSEQSDNDS